MGLDQTPPACREGVRFQIFETCIAVSSGVVGPFGSKPFELSSRRYDFGFRVPRSAAITDWGGVRVSGLSARMSPPNNLSAIVQLDDGAMPRWCPHPHTTIGSHGTPSPTSKRMRAPSPLCRGGNCRPVGDNCRHAADRHRDRTGRRTRTCAGA